MILAIETAASLVGMNDTNHGKRVGYIVSQIGHQLGFSEQDLQFAFALPPDAAHGSISRISSSIRNAPWRRSAPQGTDHGRRHRGRRRKTTRSHPFDFLC